MNKPRPPDRSPLGRPMAATIDLRVREALRFLDDPIALGDGPLSTLPVVAKLVASRYQGRTCPEGLALRALLLGILAEIGRDLEGSFVGSLANGLRNGRTQADIARELGTSEEWLCRRFKPQLIRLIREHVTASSPECRQSA